MEIAASRKVRQEPVLPAGADIVVAGQTDAATAVQLTHDRAEDWVIMLVQKDIQIVSASKSVLHRSEILNYSILQAGLIERPKQHGCNRQAWFRFKGTRRRATFSPKWQLTWCALNSGVVPGCLACRAKTVRGLAPCSPANTEAFTPDAIASSCRLLRGSSGIVELGSYFREDRKGFSQSIAAGVIRSSSVKTLLNWHHVHPTF